MRSLVILFIVGVNLFIHPYTIKGESMDPTLKDGERVVNVVGYKTGGFKGSWRSSFSCETKMMTMLNVSSVFW